MAALAHLLCTATPLYAKYEVRATQLMTKANLLVKTRVMPPIEPNIEIKQPKPNMNLTVFESHSFRTARALLIDQGPNLQVLNFCIFPKLDSPAPTFSADLVTLKGGSLIAIDCQPNGFAMDVSTRAGKMLADAYACHRPRFPHGGEIPEGARKFFSDSFLWSRVPANESAEKLHALIEPAFDDYLSAYLCVLEDSEPLCRAEDLAIVRAAQLEYAQYRITRDPARPMLSRLFGGDATERLLTETLFDLPKILGE